MYSMAFRLVKKFHCMNENHYEIMIIWVQRCEHRTTNSTWTHRTTKKKLFIKFSSKIIFQALALNWNDPINFTISNIYTMDPTMRITSNDSGFSFWQQFWSFTQCDIVVLWIKFYFLLLLVLWFIWISIRFVWCYWTPPNHSLSVESMSTVKKSMSFYLVVYEY